MCFFSGLRPEKKIKLCRTWNFSRPWFLEINVQIKRLTGGSFCPLFQAKFPDFTCQRCSTCLLVFGCCKLSHVIFLKLRMKELRANQFHSKRQPRTISNENSFQFVNLLSFASSFFFLSLRKITWLNSQQPKTRGHVEHPSHSSFLPLKYQLRKRCHD